MKENLEADYWLDITNEVCPMTFVKTKLMLEKMTAGETLAVRLPEGEPLENVPRSVSEQGDKIIRKEKDADGGGTHLLIIEKQGK